MISINSNNLASSIARNLNDNASQLQKISAQISSGKRILSAADDPAGVGILSSLKVQNSSYDAVLKNLSAGQSVLEVSDAALSSQQSTLQQMKDLATQASSSLLSANQRTALQNSFTELQKQLDDTSKNATLFGTNLIGASAATATLQVGINAGDTRTLNTAKSDATTLAVNSAVVDLTDPTKAAAAMTAIDAASATVSTNQSIIGTQMTGLSKTVDNAKTTQLALSNSISKIEDADVAALSSQLSALQAKQQLTSSVLGIVNTFPQYLLSLVR
jgi:flagellin